MTKEYLENILTEYGVAFTDSLADRLLKEFEPCEDEYIKVPKKALKYRTAGMVAYNAEWLKNHFDIERAVICGAQQSCDDLKSRDEVIDILLNEMECVQRASDDECNRDCAKCDLLRDTDKILQAYRIAIRALEHPEENVVAIVPCNDAISRETVKIEYKRRIESSLKDESRGLDLTHLVDCTRFNEFIDSIPPVNPQPKTGHWIPRNSFLLQYRCSECGRESEKYNYCPNCGAKMQEKINAKPRFGRKAK